MENMINETILGYVASERARGVTDEAIRGALLAQGWKEEDVIASMAGGAVSVAATMATGPKQYSFVNLYEGRLKRWQYFVSSVLLFLALFVVIFLMGVAVGYMGLEEDGMVYLAYAMYILTLPLGFSLVVRRIHDIGWSGWMSLLMFIPLVGTIFALIVLFKKGTDGPNTYGPPQSDRNFIRTILNT